MADHDDANVKLALLAHDLRTPLSAMRLTAELIGAGHLNADQQEKLSILIASIDSLTDMTGELVATAQVQNDTEPVLHSVEDIVSECADLFRIAAQSKDLSFDLQVAEEIRGLQTDRAAELRRVLTTLLDNAIKYTVEGRVGMRVTPGSNGTPRAEQGGVRRWIAVCVSDTGPGIDADEEDRLFRPFSRGRHGMLSGPGAGLGLWSAGQQVEAMGGRLTLVRPQNGGSQFEIRIPVLPGRPGISPDAEKAASRNRAPIDAHALIVDDNDTNCQLLAALLQSFGLTCDTANSGEEALRLVRNRVFDLVLLDIHMPGMSGLEAAAEISKTRPDGAPPLIAVTAGLETVDDERLLGAGFQSVVTRPLLPELLYDAVEQACRAGGSKDR
ncbi:response regulator [Roseibium sp. MMSF_3544]|uniref:ATP-binding response regulator n=1 Tax=unclassified Roseibium TaxID=2629323 RepID=UPI00273DFC63|nr:response regulator [Roseibium sp. MMSF_3544]